MSAGQQLRTVSILSYIHREYKGDVEPITCTASVSLLPSFCGVNGIRDSHIYSKKFWEELIVYFPLVRHGQYGNRSNYSSIIVCVFFAAVTYLPGCCLATRGGYTYRHIDWWDVFPNYTFEMDTGAIILMLRFIKISSGGIHRHTDRKVG
jgi:hypothetical protein